VIPTKFADGFTAFLYVSNATAIPGVPKNPKPPPESPNDVGTAPAAGFPKMNVNPSAPVPPLIVASNSAVNDDDDTAVG